MGSKKLAKHPMGKKPKAGKIPVKKKPAKKSAKKGAKKAKAVDSTNVVTNSEPAVSHISPTNPASATDETPVHDDLSEDEVEGHVEMADDEDDADLI